MKALAQIEEIKNRLTIMQVGAAAFPNWQVEKSCSSPFRQDQHPSFSVFDGGKLWKDFSTGESGDVISFYQRATGLSFKDATEKLAVLAGIHTEKHRPQKKANMRLPFDLHSGSEKELETVAQLRNLNVDAVQLASERGLLQFGTVCTEHCWILTDQTTKVAQVRRIVGEPFPAIRSLPERKAHTLRGSSQSWPLGLLEAAQMPHIALVEGGPDLLAAFHFAHTEGIADRVGVVAMLGAANSIPADALSHFKGKRIRIFAHDDNAGRATAIRWKAQLQTVEATVDIFDCGGVPLTGGGVSDDLNDIADLDADFWEENRPLTDHLFDFVEGK